MNRQTLVNGLRHGVVFVLLILAGCKTIQYVPVTHTEYITVRDSVAIHDTTIQYRLEREYIERYATDTLFLDTRYSEFVAYTDTTVGKLSGKAWNKEKIVEIPTQWKEHIVYRDSIVYQEKPYPVEVVKEVRHTPKFWKFFGLIGMLTVIAGAVLILRKFHII